MIDYLVFDNKNFGLKKSYILEVINFLIFRDFSKIYFDVKYLKKKLLFVR